MSRKPAPRRAIPFAPNWHIPTPCPYPSPAKRHSPPTGTISIFRLRIFAYPAVFRNTAAFSSRDTPPDEIRTRLVRPAQRPEVRYVPSPGVFGRFGPPPARGVVHRPDEFATVSQHPPPCPFRGRPDHPDEPGPRRLGRADHDRSRTRRTRGTRDRRGSGRGRGNPRRGLPRRRTRTAGEEEPRGEKRGYGSGGGHSIPSYPAGGVVPPGGAGGTIFANCMKGVSRASGTGKMVVELFSAATSRSVWR